mgnify:FL=1|jgi:hypothetical protein
MKKLLFIIVLAAFQSGCASQSGYPGRGGTLLSFEDLASEITVGYEVLADEKAPDTDIEGPLGTP